MTYYSVNEVSIIDFLVIIQQLCQIVRVYRATNSFGFLLSSMAATH